MEKIGFIGVGKVGTAFGVRLSQQGHPVVAAMDILPAEAQRFAESVAGCRVYDTAQALADDMDFVFITTPDDIIGQVAAQVKWHAGQTVIHCSGANSTLSRPSSGSCSTLISPRRVSSSRIGGSTGFIGFLRSPGVAPW